MIKSFLYDAGFVVCEILFYTVLFWLIFATTSLAVETPAISICAFVTYIVRRFWTDWKNK